MAFGMPPISSVSPSGAARATCSVPILVPAPGLFSMMTEVFSASLSGWTSSRVTMSKVPPGGNGTTILMFLPAGQSAFARAARGASGQRQGERRRDSRACASCPPVLISEQCSISEMINGLRVGVKRRSRSSSAQSRVGEKRLDLGARAARRECRHSACI